MAVLVVEDNLRLARLLAKGLGEEGFAVETVGRARAAEERLARGGIDLAILDLGLPDADGREVVASARRSALAVPILVLTARDAVESRVQALDLGADDYLVKPFAFAELVARVRALGRRSTPPLPATLRAADVTLDPKRRMAFRAGRRLDLGPKEFAVLEYLLASLDQTVSAEELLERVWDEEANPFTTTVKSTISRLRAKLGDPPVIETAREGGYRIESQQ
ncbi:MAG: response regulator transcription factor [Candidatus Limnocylindrales bacterium]